jgi:hypothetical protein
MNREDLKDIIKRVLENLQQDQNSNSPTTACLFYDKPPCDNCDKCDVTTYYAVGEEG